MKLYLMTGTDDDDCTTSLDWLVVAPDVETATTLWAGSTAVASFREHDGMASELSHAFVVLPDVTGTPYDGEARAIEWDAVADERP